MAKTQSASASPTCRHPIRDRTASAAPNRAGGSSSPPPQLRQSRRLMRHIPQETQVLERAADTLLSPHVRHRVVLPAKEEHPQREQPEAKPRDARKAARDSGLAGDQGPQRLERQQRKEQDRAFSLLSTMAAPQSSAQGLRCSRAMAKRIPSGKYRSSTC